MTTHSPAVVVVIGVAGVVFEGVSVNLKELSVPASCESGHLRAGISAVSVVGSVSFLAASTTTHG